LHTFERIVRYLKRSGHFIFIKKKIYRKVQLYSKKVKKHKLHAIKINKVFISINVCLISNLVNTKASITKISERKFITIFIHVYGHLWIHVKLL